MAHRAAMLPLVDFRDFIDFDAASVAAPHAIHARAFTEPQIAGVVKKLLRAYGQVREPATALSDVTAGCAECERDKVAEVRPLGGAVISIRYAGRGGDEECADGA